MTDSVSRLSIYFSSSFRWPPDHVEVFAHSFTLVLRGSLRYCLNIPFNTVIVYKEESGSQAAAQADINFLLTSDHVHFSILASHVVF